MSPIAPPGTLAASSSVLVAVLPHEGASIAPAGTVVYLAFSAAPGGATASVGATALTATPTPSVTPSSGEVVVTTVPESRADRGRLGQLQLLSETARGRFRPRLPRHDARMAHQDAARLGPRPHPQVPPPLRSSGSDVASGA
jgi:hypothetical protein